MTIRSYRPCRGLVHLSSLNSYLLKWGLSLPSALLRGLSGGGVTYSQGRTLDPQIQFLWRGFFTRPGGYVGLSLTGKSLETAREEWQATVDLFGLPADIRVRFENLNEAGAPAGLLIRPERISEDAPVLVLLHQGGGVLGGPGLSRAFGALMAHEAHCPIFIPEYRLAPLNRFPAGLEDARAAFEWAQANAMRLGARSGQTAISGILTGAGMALRIALDLQREDKPLPAGLLLVTPLLDFADPALKSATTPALWPLAAADLDLLADHYAGAGTDLTDPRLSPARAELTEALPKTLIVSGGFDPLAFQGEACARRLIAAGVPTVYRRYDTLPLGFDLFAGLVEGVQQATQDIAATWLDLLRHQVA
ncbi:MAG: alpha/beta hydrolase fold domain-containing protein [Asticcacaulis sp.]|uniref:alpha/beta hydrolase fold domain-containing protein n=1 Tax=Asticcacaulis sp. TaxID=1872648 RepID=UPI0039E3A2D8